MTPARAAYVRSLALIVFIASFALILSQALTLRLLRDEHQFILAGYFVADGLTPYRDFPSFHMPYLAYIYAFLFRFTDQYFLTARLFSVASASLMAAGFAALAYRALDRLPEAARLPAVVLAWLALVSNTLFALTAGRAWNHIVALAICFFAFTILERRLFEERTMIRLFWSGVLMGVASGMRLNYGGIAVLFGLAVLFCDPDRRKGSWRPPFLYAAGFALSFLPVVAVFAADPVRAFFGTCTFVHPDQVFGEPGRAWTRNFFPKLGFFGEKVFSVPSNFGVLYTLALAVPCMLLSGRRSAHSRRFIFAVLTALAFFASIFFLKTPYWCYYTPALVFAGVALVSAAAHLFADGKSSAAVRAIGLICLAALAIYTGMDFKDRYLKKDRLERLWTRDRWETDRVRDVGERMSYLVPKGKVLTVTPIYAIEGGFEPYPGFATGAYSWKHAAKFKKEARLRMGIYSKDDLRDLIGDEPPVAVLTGFDTQFEGPISRYARRNGFEPRLFGRKVKLWLRR